MATCRMVAFGRNRSAFLRPWPAAHLGWLPAVIASCLPAGAAMAQEAPAVLKITQNTRLEKDSTLRTPIVIEADNIILDGNGATIEGPGRPDDPKSFAGSGVTAAGRSRITIRNLKIKGFEHGLTAADGNTWSIENCDFSDNARLPVTGAADLSRAGGMNFTQVSRCVIRNTKANRVWNGLDLRGCNDGSIARNDFSYCANAAMILSRSALNVVDANNLSHALRGTPEESRASAGLILENGAYRNTIMNNDITHCGDGVVLLSRNGWHPQLNTFTSNDCSHALYVGFRSSSPDNAFQRNKANHCSHGFWMGGSNQVRLVENEAAFNGLADGPHHDPDPRFQYGGIVFAEGAGADVVIENNHCHHNNGAGIALLDDPAATGAQAKLCHFIVSGNRLEDNQTGLMLRGGHWITLGNNIFSNNRQDELVEEVTQLNRLEPATEAGRFPSFRVYGQQQNVVGETAIFRLVPPNPSHSRPLNIRWEIGGEIYTTPTAEHRFDQPGHYRIGVTIDDGQRATLGFLDHYVHSPTEERATESGADEWTFEMTGNDGTPPGRVEFVNDGPVHIAGAAAVRCTVRPYAGQRVSLLYPKSRSAQWDLSGKKTLCFWLRHQNPNRGGFTAPSPVAVLRQGPSAVTYTPSADGRPASLLNHPSEGNTRLGWLHFSIPLAGDDRWHRVEMTPSADGQNHESAGAAVDLTKVDYLSIQLNAEGTEPFEVWIDGMEFK